MALASMSEIFERMARNGQEFWEVVLADDMDERQVSRERSEEHTSELQSR